LTKYTYITTLVLLILSYVKDKKRTRMALVKGVKSLVNILGQFSAILILVGLMLTFISPGTISAILGARAGAAGMFVASVLGSITIIPGFVAFPLAKSLLDRGAGIMQIAVLLSTLMMVGVLTMPLEFRYLGRRETYLRNGFAYLWSFVAAAIMGLVIR